jgi:hypothetical protein
LTLAELYQQIEQLSDKVESLIDAKNEADCAELLTQRQSLLEQLAKQVADISDANIAQQENDQYLTFLRRVQTRDNKYLALVQAQKQQIYTEQKQQSKTNKAIKAYNSI